MTDGIRFDLSPRTEFADRLEADLLRAISGPGHATTTNTTTNTSTRATTPPDTEAEHLMTITLEPPVDSPTPNRRAWRAALAVAAAAILILVGVWAVGRSDDTPAGTHDVSFTVTWHEGTTIRDCPSDVSSPICAFRYDGSATAKFSGDIDGNAYQSVVWPFSDDFADRAVRHEEKAATYVFGGSVAGCGTGEFLMVETLQSVSGADRDFSKGTTTGAWTIVPDSGRNGLRSISGSGTSTSQPVDFSRDRTFTGTVTCTPPKDLSANEIIAPLGSVAVPTDAASVTPDAGDLPNGTYRTEFTAADLDRLEPDIVHDFAAGGAIEVTLKDGRYTAQGFLPSGTRDGDPFQGVYQVTGNTLVWVLPQASQIPNSDGIMVFEWKIDGDTLTFTQIDGKHRDPWFAAPYTKVG